MSNYISFLTENHPVYKDVDIKFVKERNQTSYTHGRKATAGLLSDRSDVQFNFVVFRLGWELKIMHSLYDYVQNSRIKDIKAARAISDWHKDSRGVSATFLSIKTDVPRAETFLQALFGHQEFMSDRVGYLLFGSLLIGWTEFIRILKSEPTGKFGDVRKHPVVRKV